jgi:hypothetical protein
MGFGEGAMTQWRLRTRSEPATWRMCRRRKPTSLSFRLHCAEERAGSAPPRSSLYDEATARIISELEEGRFPWVQPLSNSAESSHLIVKPRLIANCMALSCGA